MYHRLAVSWNNAGDGLWIISRVLVIYYTIRDLLDCTDTYVCIYDVVMYPHIMVSSPWKMYQDQGLALSLYSALSCWNTTDR